MSRPPAPLTPRRFIADSLRHHRRIHLAVALGTAAATAVLTGALLVGDSVRGSLRETALDRLGGVEEVLVSDKFFRGELVEQLAKNHAAHDQNSEGRHRFGPTEAAVVLQGAVTNPNTKAHAAQVTLLGSDNNSRHLHLPYLLSHGWTKERLERTELAPPVPQQDDEVYLNRPLADELGVKEGDEVIVRLPTSRDVPPESALGRKTDAVANTPRLKVKWIVPAEGFGAFSLRPNQQAAKNAYLTTAALQKALDKPGRVNAVFAFGSANDPQTLQQNHKFLSLSLTPNLKLPDYGLKWAVAKPGYFNLTCERMLFDPPLEQAARAAYNDLDPQPVFTYLANTIAAGKKEIPYSTIAALDVVDRPTLGPFRTADGKPIEKIADDEIVLTTWAANDLNAKPGDAIRIKYFKPESTHADVEEAEAAFKLKAIAELKPKDDPLLSADLTPELPGVTDQLKMDQWDPPFPYESRRIRDVDEDYWDQYRATPKAFVSTATGRKLWGSRFGQLTSLRVAPRPGLTIEKLEAMFQPDPASLGFVFQPVRLRAIEASSGTTPFEGLFLGFSFFIIAAAVMLTALLFRLGVERRAEEVGVLLAVGLPVKRVGRLLLVEGSIVALIGAGLGLALGVGYAWLMLAGLRTLWLDAVTVPFLTLFVTAKSLSIGYAAGVLVSLGAIGWSLRALRRLPVRRLLAGQAAESDLPGATAGLSGSADRPSEPLPYKPAVAPRKKLGPIVAWGSLALAIVAALAATRLTDEAQAGAFLGSAALVLTALLTFLRRQLAAARFGSLVGAGRGRIAVLAVRNAARNPGRSMLTIGLVAAAAFLIVAVSAFRIAPPSTYVEKTSGTGGFALVAQSDLPILPDLNTGDGRADLNLSTAQIKKLGDAKAYACRFRPGDDSSCLNLYQTEQPRVIGVGDAFLDRGGFSWAATDANTDDERANPWRMLRRTTAINSNARELVHYHEFPDEVPIVLDQATAIYGLHLSGVGARFELQTASQQTIACRVVGLLRNSVLQGSVVMAETHFKRLFPEVSGYRYFFVEAPPDRAADVAQTLEAGLADFGFDAEQTDRVLTAFLAVQNTYLSTFQSLGGLGLLLGTFGLATVQMRNALERRGELALLRAVGLSQSLLARLVFWENGALLIGGLGCGVLAALVAVLPHALGGGAGVPWIGLGATLGAVVVVGLATGAVVVRAVLRMPVLASLRGQ